MHSQHDLKRAPVLAICITSMCLKLYCIIVNLVLPYLDSIKGDSLQSRFAETHEDESQSGMLAYIYANISMTSTIYPDIECPQAETRAISI